MYFQCKKHLDQKQKVKCFKTLATFLCMCLCTACVSSDLVLYYMLNKQVLFMCLLDEMIVMSDFFYFH